MTREMTLTRALVELADSLVEDFDVVELLTVLTDRCVEVLDVSAAGLILIVEGELRLMTSSSQAMRVPVLAQLLNDQLTHALNSRIVIEQAKGMLAERAGLDMDQAFSRLRGYARNKNLRLADVAGDVVAGAIDTDTVAQLPPRRR